MYWRMGILKDHGLGLKEIQAVIERIDPLPGARAFLDALRDRAQVVILSDTFAEFAKPLLEKLGRPTIFCNSLAVSPTGKLTDIRMCNALEVAPDGMIADYHIRVAQSKLSTVKALQSVGFETIAVGDSYNDIDMLLVSKAGFLFRTTDKIKATYPQLPAFTAYDDLLAAITEVLE